MIEYIYYYFHNGYKTISIYRVDIEKCNFQLYYDGAWIQGERSPYTLRSMGSPNRVLRQITEEQAYAYIGKEKLIAKLLK